MALGKAPMTVGRLLGWTGLLALGYAGWGDGQIEEELAENVWLVADADLDLIFDDDHDGKWAGALARIGVDAAWLSSDAGHA